MPGGPGFALDMDFSIALSSAFDIVGAETSALWSVFICMNNVFDGRLVQDWSRQGAQQDVTRSSLSYRGRDG